MSVLHDLGRVVIRRIAVSAMDNAVYLITAKATGEQVLIDAADDADAIIGMLRESAADSPRPTRVAVIATTHRHPDHIRALAALAAHTGASLAAGADDADEIERRTGVSIATRLSGGGVLACEGFELGAIPLRGHTDGSIALSYEGDGATHLFTGDSLFPGGVGNTNGDPVRFARLLGDVTARLFDRFGDETIVHPGHGAGTTLGAERPNLAQWRDRGW